MNSANSKKEWQPYMYRVTHKRSGLKYIGVRYAKGCHPSELFVKYFTSSNRVKYLVERDGIESFHIEIRKVFNIQKILLQSLSKSDIMELYGNDSNYQSLYSSQHFLKKLKRTVLSYESKVLQRIKAKHRRDYLNQTDGTEDMTILKQYGGLIG